MFLDKHKFLRNSLLLSLASVGFAHFSFDHHPGHHPGQNPIASQSSIELKEQTPSEKSLTRAPASVMEANADKAVIVLEKDPKNPNSPGVYRIMLPKEKRLYDEARMQEIAKDANLETVELEYNQNLE